MSIGGPVSNKLSKKQIEQMAKISIIMKSSGLFRGGNLAIPVYLSQIVLEMKLLLAEGKLFENALEDMGPTTQDSVRKGILLKHQIVIEKLNIFSDEVKRLGYDKGKLQATK